MTACGVASEDEFVNVEAKLVLSMRNYPDVGLVRIIDWIRVWILRSQSVIDAKDWYAELYSPLPRIVLVGARILAAETSTVEMYNCLIEVLGIVCSNYW